MSFFKNKFDSIKQDWNTPKKLFNQLNEEFNFEWDLASSNENKLCEKNYTDSEDGLKQDWKDVCWCNPPYGDKKSKMVDWIKKAFESTQNENNDLTVVMLIPARTNTNWFHKYCLKSYELRFLEGRPKFGDSKHGLPQPLCLVIFKNIKYENTKITSLKYTN